MQVHSTDYLYSVAVDSINNEQLASYSLDVEKYLKPTLIMEPKNCRIGTLQINTKTCHGET